MEKVEAVLNATADKATLTPQMQRMMSRQAENTKRVEETIKGTKSNPRWFVPVFCALMIIGLIWCVVYYLSPSGFLADSEYRRLEPCHRFRPDYDWLPDDYGLALSSPIVLLRKPVLLASRAGFLRFCLATGAEPPLSADPAYGYIVVPLWQLPPAPASFALAQSLTHNYPPVIH